MKKASRAQLFAHPILFALFPICHLYFSNLEKLHAFAFLRPACVLIAVVTTLVLALSVGTRNTAKAAAVSSILILAFYVCWGAFMRNGVYALSETIGIHARYVFAVYALGILFLTAWLWRTKRRLDGLNRFALIVATILVILSPLSAFHTLLRPSSKAAHLRLSTSLIPEKLSVAPIDQLPDVYFIVLDGYGRADILREIYGFDNQPFLEAMKARGFFIADRAHQNYWTTLHCIPACLNMDYFENFGPPPQAYSHQELVALYRDNQVHKLFRQLGYELVGTETGFSPTEPRDEFSSILRFQAFGLTPTPFESYLFEYTPFPRILRYMGIDFAQSAWYNRVVYILDNLHVPSAKHTDKPVYVQAHIMSPHDPFIFNADGSRCEPILAFSLDGKEGIYPPFDEVRELYTRQIQGLNLHVEKAIDQILNSSDRPVIIALVSDHGPGMTGRADERLSSLLMLRLPGTSPSELSRDMNLVELFPVIFDKGLGVKLPWPQDPAQQ